MSKESKIYLRVSDQQKAELQANADEAGMTLSAFLVAKGLGHTNVNRVRTSEPPEQTVRTKAKINLPPRPLHVPDTHTRDYSGAYSSPSKEAAPTPPIIVNPDAYTK